MGEQYGLSKKEFDYALTIQSPRRGERIFYPVHVLSRSQATTNRWDGNLVKSLSLYTARTMKKYCNKWAVALKLDEPHAAEAMTYFFAAYYILRTVCSDQKDQAHSNQRADAVVQPRSLGSAHSPLGPSSVQDIPGQK